MNKIRKAETRRKTKETDIFMALDLDSDKDSIIKTPIPFFTHMLETFSKHGGFHLTAEIKGDIEVDLHHTVEDSGIVLGSLVREALGDKTGINRFGYAYVPMDEALVRSVIDLSGRSFFVCNIGMINGRIGQFGKDTCKHFFRSFTDQLQANIHIELLYGEDPHHTIEGIFKSCARALKEAKMVCGTEIPSTKGVI